MRRYGYMLRLAMMSWVLITWTATKSRAQEMILQLDPNDTKVEISLSASLHTVHGAFRLKSGSIQFNPSSGTAGGLVIVDTTSGDTGNKSRDHKMHSEVLQSKQYPEVTFTPTRISGALPGGGTFTAQVEGILNLHGSEHPVTLPVQGQVSAGVLTATAELTIPYVAWGLKNPSTFLLHVKDRVDLHLTAKGHLTISDSTASH